MGLRNSSRLFRCSMIFKLLNLLIAFWKIIKRSKQSSLLSLGPTKNLKRCARQSLKSASTLLIWCRLSSKRMNWERNSAERPWSLINHRLTGRSCRIRSDDRSPNLSTTRCSAPLQLGYLSIIMITVRSLSMTRGPVVSRWRVMGSLVVRSPRSAAPKFEKSFEDRCRATKREERGRKKRMIGMGSDLTLWSEKCRSRTMRDSRSRKKCISRWWLNIGTTWSRRSKSLLISTASSNPE